MEWYWWVAIGYLIIAFVFYLLLKNIWEEVNIGRGGGPEEEFWGKIPFLKIFKKYPSLLLNMISLFWLPEIILGSFMLFLKQVRPRPHDH